MFESDQMHICFLYDHPCYRLMRKWSWCDTILRSPTQLLWWSRIIFLVLPNLTCYKAAVCWKGTCRWALIIIPPAISLLRPISRPLISRALSTGMPEGLDVKRSSKREVKYSVFYFTALNHVTDIYLRHTTEPSLLNNSLLIGIL